MKFAYKIIYNIEPFHCGTQYGENVFLHLLSSVDNFEEIESKSLNNQES